VRLLSGLIGPGHPFPELDSGMGWVPLAAATLKQADEPVLVELGADPELGREFPSAEFALLETTALQRRQIRHGLWYALRWGGGGWVRRLRREGKRLIVQGQGNLRPTLGPQTIELDNTPLSEYLRGVVVWIGPDPRRVDPLGTGLYLTPPTADS
jgi:hypothetical protein